MNTPLKISIVTPNFNGEKYLEKTIQSVLSQNYSNLEYILVDGNSTDNSIDIIHKYTNYFSEIVIESDKGHYDAVNKGLSRSTGEVLAFLNSDDMYYPWTLQVVSEIFTKFPQIEWLTTLNPGYFDSTDTPLEFSCFKGYSKNSFIDGYHSTVGPCNNNGLIQQESTFWRRSLWEKIGGNININKTYAGDFDLWSRFFQHSNLYAVKVPLAGFRIQESQRSANMGTKYNDESLDSLNNLRNTVSWRPCKIRTTFRNLNLNNITFLGKYFTKYAGYEGYIVEREKKRNNQFDWVIKKYKF